MSAVTTTGRAIPRQARVRTVPLPTVIALVLLLLAAGYLQYGRMTRPTVRIVAEKAAVGFDDRPREALARTVDGLGFPRWDGFQAIGGSAFEVADRGAASVVYARGNDRITYAIVSGTDHVNFGGGTVRYRKIGGRTVEFVWVSDSLLTFKRNSRTVVMVGTPASQKLRRVMWRLAQQPVR